MQIFTNASSLLPESRFLSSSKTALQGPGPQLLPVLGRGSGGVVVLEVRGAPSQRGQDSGLNQHWAPEKATWCSSGFPRGVGKASGHWSGPLAWPSHVLAPGPPACGSPRQPSPTGRHTHPMMAPLVSDWGPSLGPPSLWARASWTLSEWGARMAALVLLRDGPKGVCALVPPSVHLCKGRPRWSLARQRPGLCPATRGQQVTCIL